MGSLGPALAPSTAQYNPYANDATSLQGSGAAYYPQVFSTGLVHPPNYHLYQPYGTYRSDLLPHQRATYDFFIPQKLREELQKKLFATQQVLPSMSHGSNLEFKQLTLPRFHTAPA